MNIRVQLDTDEYDILGRNLISILTQWIDISRAKPGNFLTK